MKRFAIGSVVLGMTAILLTGSPAAASHHHGKWAPAVRVYAYSNDDGRVGPLDPGDVGGISASYDRWGHWSSDDPSTPGMGAERLDGDVARCAVRNTSARSLRLTIQNAYPGYTCTFVLMTVNKPGIELVVDQIDIEVDPALQLTELGTPESGDGWKRRRRSYGAYAVTVRQGATQGDTVEFAIHITLARPQPARHRPWCCR